jgi:hypothetical protein
VCSILPQQVHDDASQPTSLQANVQLPHLIQPAYEPSVFPPDGQEFWLWAIPVEMGARLVGTTYQEAFAHGLHHRLVTPQTIQEQTERWPQKRLLICCSIWTTSANLEFGRPETEVLMESLLAASLAIVGRNRRDPDMALHGAYMQTRALQRLRHSLTRYQEGDRSICPTTLSLTALTCAISELIANKSWDNFNRHLMGVGALIFHGGVEVGCAKVARLNFSRNSNFPEPSQATSS